KRRTHSAGRRYLTILAFVFFSAGFIVYFGKPILLGTGKIAGCRANHYSDDSYLAYCASKGYGDYEHGAFYFDMEPAARDALRRAAVVFLGNSIPQFAFSTTSTAEIFRTNGVRYYLLGFAYFETVDFAQMLARRLPLRPRVAVLNADKYFWSQKVSAPSAALQANLLSTRFDYAEKAMWQSIHARICGSLLANARFCGQTLSIFRSRGNGAWVGLSDWGLPSRPLAQSPSGHAITETENLQRAERASRLAAALQIPAHCLVITTIPNDETEKDAGMRLATLTGATYIAPAIEKLATLDGIHLDALSAESWSRAFVRELLEKTAGCVSSHP
ncbi:MAG: hypothetical protein ABL891_22625, partial [Burkholderiales bacterium]